jgi:hypothetical protein
MRLFINITDLIKIYLRKEGIKLITNHVSKL